MSLKTFHLVFITACTVLALFCGAWWIQEFIWQDAGMSALVAGLSAIAFAVGLGCYERYFLKKLSHMAHL